MHHDIPLPVFPLWMGAAGRVQGRWAADATSSRWAPSALHRVWNLDVIDALEPAAGLGSRGCREVFDANAAAHEAACAAATRTARRRSRSGP